MPTPIVWGDTSPPHHKGCATVANDKNNRYHLLGHPPRTRVRGVYAVVFRKNPPFSSRNPSFAHCTPFPYNEPEHGTNSPQAKSCTVLPLLSKSLVSISTTTCNPSRWPTDPLSSSKQGGIFRQASRYGRARDDFVRSFFRRTPSLNAKTRWKRRERPPSPAVKIGGIHPSSRSIRTREKGVYAVDFWTNPPFPFRNHIHSFNSPLHPKPHAVRQPTKPFGK